ncbi:SH3 domain-containing protein Dlish [Frieseomelitta varia]|uniref:SH3 domain-containing protein Dlish n=1 Tax=Frieseomelitta varia TaxID=561572 RepID=UPI001CB6A396|nr:SH3 domain-containing protein Dlish [Frieseomelitta varia]XP_043525891.1 SH3 domain-containing protein Dlish [Frieseomelitta varia]XP_043525892.1 SH3 domain-containing protein Dlish [Frieseomelitta varia]
MAFLCPVRIRRGKKKKPGVHNFNLEKDCAGAGGTGLGLGTKVPLPPGRITGSASIETLVRVGIEKENGLSPDSKMVIVHDFTPCVDDELQVKRGQVVNVLYRENDWVYVIAADTRMEGFVPHSYCAPYTSQLAELTLATLMNNVKKKLPRSNETDCDFTGTGRPQTIDTQQTDTGSASDCESYARNVTTADVNVNRSNITQSQNSIQTVSSQPDVHPFFKDPSAGRYIVLYTFVARDENDVSVERGEFVTVLNRDDPDWFWVLRHCDGNEGFVPSGFVYPGHVLHSYATTTTTTTTTTTVATTSTETHGLGKGNNNMTGNESLQQKGLRDFRDETNGTELVVLYDYKAQAPDDLSVRRADWIYADLGNQTVDGWLWAYAPKTRKYGFIPKAYARPPAMTSL